MDSQKSLWWPVAVLGIGMIAVIALGTKGLSWFIWSAGVWTALFFIIIIALEAKREGHQQAAATG